jgi:hypothetical protein
MGRIIGNAIVIYVNKISTLFDEAKVENIFQYTKKIVVKNLYLGTNRVKLRMMAEMPLRAEIPDQVRDDGEKLTVMPKK